ATAVLALKRDAAGDLAFDLYSKEGVIARRTQLIGQAVGQIAIQDRLTRAGGSPTDQPKLFAPPTFNVLAADPGANLGPGSSAEAASLFLVSFGLSITLFMAIILYGQWIAFTVAEGKKSRVVEGVVASRTRVSITAV